MQTMLFLYPIPTTPCPTHCPTPSILTFIHVECEGSNGDADHALAVLEELDGLRVEGEVPEVLVVEEVDGVPVEVE